MARGTMSNKERLAVIETKIGSLESSVERLESSIGRLEITQKLDFRILLGVIGASWAGVISALWYIATHSVIQMVK